MGRRREPRSSADRRLPWFELHERLSRKPGNSIKSRFLIYAAARALCNVHRSHGVRPFASVD
jgi:hypothetical protein